MIRYLDWPIDWLKKRKWGLWLLAVISLIPAAIEERRIQRGH